jgi:GNAT superfamily N-acetyltransferase
MTADDAPADVPGPADASAATALRAAGIVLVPASGEDADALADLRVAAMRESLERLGRFDPARARARLLDRFSPGHTRHIVVDGARVGLVVVRPEGNALHVEHLYLVPARQGAGIGGAVLTAVCAEAAAQRKDVRVGALRGSAANRFYRRHGFVPDSEAEFDIFYVRACPAA